MRRSSLLFWPRFTGSPAACESGVSEYRKYHQIICGKVDNAHVDQTICEGETVKGKCQGFICRVTDMIHVHYARGTNPIGGDSGGPTGSGKGLLGLVTDSGGDSTKAKNGAKTARDASSNAG